MRLHHCWQTTADGPIHARYLVTPTTAGRTPLVLVHGFGVSSAYFVPLAQRLAVDFPVYVPDLPGHGPTPPPDQPPGIQDLADWLIRWMDAMNIDRAHVIGNSLGCQTVVEAALRHPGRMERLVLIGPPNPAGRTVGYFMTRLLLGLPFMHPALYAQALADYARIGRHLMPELNVVIEDGLAHKLPQLTRPTLLVRGERDTLVSADWIRCASRSLGGAPILEIPRWGHAVHYNAPDQVAHGIRAFLMESNQDEAGQDQSAPSYSDNGLATIRSSFAKARATVFA